MASAHHLPDFSLLFSRGQHEETLKPGAVIFREGEVARCAYVVRTGTVEIQVKGRTLDRLGPGEIFGEMALIDRAPRSATAVAATEASVIPIDEDNFLFLVERTPYFALNVMRTLAARLRQMDERI